MVAAGDRCGLALLGVFVAQIVIIVQMRVAGKRWRREQTLGMVRWAAELAADENQAKASLGVETLNALGDSSLLVVEDQVLLDAALLTAAEGPYDEETTDDEDEEVDEDAGEEGGWLRRRARRLLRRLGSRSEQPS